MKAHAIKTHVIGLALLTGLMVQGVAVAADFKVVCTIDRSKITVPVPYQEITLRLPIGNATSADVLVDGKTIASRIDPVAKRLVFTTKGSSIEIHVFGASAQSQIGSFSTAVLKDDKKWAWSMGFDDNNEFLRYSTEIFNQYGWAGTLLLIGMNIVTDSVDYNGKEIWSPVTDPHMRRLHKLGWAMGNHSWSHSGAGSMDELVKCSDRIKLALAPTDPTYKPATFAGPMLSHDYDNIIKATRMDPNGPGIMFSEAGGSESGNMRIDVNGPAEATAWGRSNNITTFDASELWIPRNVHTPCFFNPAYKNSVYDTEHPLEYIIDSIVKYSNSDDQHHYWLNSFDHGADGVRTDNDPANDSVGVLGLVPYLYKHYGPGGDNTIWVAPSENIFSYVITQRHATLTGVAISPYTGTGLQYAISSGKNLSGPALDKSVIPGKAMATSALIFNLRGSQVHHGATRTQGLYVVKTRIAVRY
jgi:hypothetical protein